MSIVFIYVSEINLGWEQERDINGVKEKITIIGHNSVRGANGTKEN